MRSMREADPWDEVWAEYDARRQAVAPRPVPKRTGKAPPRPAIRPLARAAAGLGAGTALLLCWLALPWLLSARLTLPLGTADAPALMSQLDATAVGESLRAALLREVPDGAGEGARRFLGAMAERMASSWSRPEGVSAWMAARGPGGRGEGPVAALSTLRSARATGLSSFRLEYGPRRGEDGVAFDLAWQDGAFRVTGLRFLGDAPAPFPAPAVPVIAARGRALAMR